MEQKNRSVWYSWPVIIITMIFFWPVGIYLLFKRISGDTRAEMSAKAVCIKYAGICLCALALLFLFALFGESNESSDVGSTFAMALFFAAGGAALLIYGKNVTREAGDTRKYLSIIVNGCVREIDEIAAAAGKPAESVKRELQRMIDKGYLKNAYIDEAARRIVLANDHVEKYEDAESPVEHTAVQTHMIVCPNCGANNVAASENAECEYCGSLLQ